MRVARDGQERRGMDVGRIALCDRTTSDLLRFNSLNCAAVAPQYPQPLPRLPSHPLLHTLSRQCVSSLPFSKSPYHPLLNPTPTDLNPRSNPSPSCQKICIPTQYTLIPQIDKPTLNHRNQERRDFVSWVFEGERRENVGMGVR